MRTGLTIFLIASLVLISSLAWAGDTEQDLRAAAQQIDRAAASPQGAQKVTASLSEEFKVPQSTIQDLRAHKLGFGEISILLALSQATGKPTSQLLGEFKSGEGWGKIAKNEGTKLGPIISAVERANPAVAEAKSKGMSQEGEKHGEGAFSNVGLPGQSGGRGGGGSSAGGSMGGGVGGGVGGGLGGHGGGHGR